MFSYHDWHRVCAKIQGPVASWWNDKAEFSWHLKATKTKFLSLCRLCMKTSMQSILKFDVLWLKLKNFVRFLLRFPKLNLDQEDSFDESFIIHSMFCLKFIHALGYISWVKCVFFGKIVTVAETADHPYGAPSATWVAKAGRNISQRFVFGPAMQDLGPKYLKWNNSVQKMLK